MEVFGSKFQAFLKQIGYFDYIIYYIMSKDSQSKQRDSKSKRTQTWVYKQIQSQAQIKRISGQQQAPPTHISKPKQRVNAFILLVCLLIAANLALLGYKYWLNLKSPRTHQLNPAYVQNPPALHNTSLSNSSSGPQDQKQIEGTNRHRHQFPSEASPPKRAVSPSQRVSLGQTHKSVANLQLLVIRTKKQGQLDCSIINSASMWAFDSTTVLRTVSNLLKMQKMRKVIIFTGRLNAKRRISEGIIKMKQLLQGEQEIQIIEQILFDSEYKFIRNHAGECGKMVYLQSESEVGVKEAQVLERELENMKDAIVSYSRSCLASLSNDSSSIGVEDLRELVDLNIEELTESQIARYAFIFDSKLLSIITPLGFSYHTAYNLEHFLIYPLLALTQGSPALQPFSTPFHLCPPHFLNSQDFPLKNLLKQESGLCFVSYPSNPYLPNEQQFNSYIQSIGNMQMTSKFLVSVVVYTPYQHIRRGVSLRGWVDKLLAISRKEGIIRVRLRILGNKTVSSHAVYESAYLYCPSKSVIVSSRHNIVFDQLFANEVSKNINQKHHYYHVAHRQQSTGRMVSLDQVPRYRGPYFIRQNPNQLYQTYFQHVQIFKSDLIKTTPFWILKSAELDFYETEAVFFIYMMECLRMNVYYVNTPLVTVQQRNQTQIEKQQIRNLQKYVEYSPLPGNILVPYLYNCLENDAYRRFAPNRIEKIVHQIWVGSSSISKIRMKLHETILLHNPTYEVILWKNSNITKQNFPLTYSLVQKTFQYQKTSRRSYYALAADLLRYEILYQRGGIYIDFKMEVLKSLDPFLKYQIFFIDAGVDSTRLRSPVAVGVGIIGAMQNSYYFRAILTEIISQSNIKFSNEYIPGMTGGAVVRKVFTDEELFTIVGFGYHLFIPRPSTGGINDCGKVNNFGSDQEIFEITDPRNRRVYRLGIPCKEYPEAYILSYKPLASSWKGDKRNMN